MSRHTRIVVTAVCSLSLALALTAVAQQTAAPAEKKEAKKGPPVRPGIFFSETWKQKTKLVQEPVTQDFVATPNLELKVYGGGPNGATILSSQRSAAEQPHVWNGLCNPTCALALRDRNNYADLTGLARIGLETYVSGFHQIRPIIKLADGTWLVSEQSVGMAADFHYTEWMVQDLRWRKLDIAHVLEDADGRWITPDLSRVDEIGFTDLTAGNGHGQGGWADVGKIEVHGKKVAR